MIIHMNNPGLLDYSSGRGTAPLFLNTGTYRGCPLYDENNL
jgi:hypothetical protein